jgi:Fe-S-cluster containining protein
MAKHKSIDTVEADMNLSIGKEKVSLRVSVEAGLTSPATLLKFVQAFSDKTVQIAVNNSLEEGKTISCKKGCGACCAQLVPVTEVEIRHIALLIKGLPMERKQLIMTRFDQARSKLHTAGLWQQLINPATFDEQDIIHFGLTYFELGIYCPFLIDDACSIHADRPIACREYLVTSDAQYCAQPRAEKIEGVSIPIRLSAVLGRLCEADCHHHADWVPLILAPYWQSLHPNQPTKKTGQQWVELFLEKLTDMSKE